MSEFNITYGWNAGEVQVQAVEADDFAAACIVARRELGSAWSYVMVTELSSGRQLNVAQHRSHDKTLTPEQWVTAALAPPPEIPIVSIDTFMQGVIATAQKQPGSLDSRPVWIVIDGMMYRPAAMGAGDEFGEVFITIDRAPAGTYDMTKLGITS